MEAIKQLGLRAKAAARSFGTALSDDKNKALAAIAQGLEDNLPAILAANARDIAAAEENGVRSAMVDRLRLTEARIRDIAAAVRHIVTLPDPVGKVDLGMVRPNGLRIYKTRVPMGVVGIIFEARPNVTVDAAALCIKSGNVCILRGGKEAIHSNKALATVMGDALQSCGFSRDVVLLVEDTSRESANAMMTLNGCIDVLIPRGGAGLISAVVQNATVPVIETGVGNCHIYVDKAADLAMAAAILDNAKTSRPSVCNAAETLLVHSRVAAEFLPAAKALLDNHRVELRGCEKTAAILGDAVKPATHEDYATEFNDYILAIKVVESFEEAVDHIAAYSTGHSEAIITEDYSAAQAFLSQVDAAAVYVNASTRFTDGGEFGFGAEIGISTQKLHTRGPMGLEELTTVKYLVYGNGQIR